MAALDRQAPTLIEIPDTVELRGERLVWKGVAQHKLPPPSLLASFAGLADAPNAQILDFAREWGVLRICWEHELPSSHFRCPPTWQPADEEDRRARGYFNSCPLTEEKDGIYSEPLEAWRHYAREARATLNLIAQIDHGDLGSPADWAAFYPAGVTPRTTEVARMVVSTIVTGWIEVGGVRPEVHWTEEGRMVLFGNRTLFGALAHQLLIALTRAPDLALCSECGNAFLPTRRPRADQRHYCAACGRAAAVRAAVRDHQQRASKKRRHKGRK